MRYIQLTTHGLGALPHATARAALKRLCDQYPGEGQIQITRPGSDGTYWVVIAGLNRSEAFLAFLRQQAVGCAVSTKLPAGKQIRPARPKSQVEGTLLLLLEFLSRGKPRRR